MRKPNWNYADGWHPVERICGYRGFWVEIGYNEDAANGYVWCVQCCGSGHYFKTKGECYAYCEGRGLHRVLNENRAWEHCVKYGLT